MVEEYLDDISLNDNPYEGMVDECVRRQSQQVFTQSSGRSRQSPQYDFVQAGPEIAFPECVTSQRVEPSQLNSSGVKITVNDDGFDVADVETGHNTKWVCASSHWRNVLLTMFFVATTTIKDVSVFFGLFGRRSAPFDSLTSCAVVFKLCTWEKRKSRTIIDFAEG